MHPSDADERDDGMPLPPSFTNPFLDLLGVEGTGLAPGTASTVLDQRSELSNMHGAVHGGVIMALLDTTMARAAMAHQGFRLSVVSIGVSVNFLRPGFGRLSTDARVTGGGKSTCFCEGEVKDAEGNLVAKGLGTFKYRKPPAGTPPRGGVSVAEVVE